MGECTKYPVVTSSVWGLEAFLKVWLLTKKVMFPIFALQPTQLNNWWKQDNKQPVRRIYRYSTVKFAQLCNKRSVSCRRREEDDELLSTTAVHHTRQNNSLEFTSREETKPAADVSPFGSSGIKHLPPPYLCLRSQMCAFTARCALRTRCASASRVRILQKASQKLRPLLSFPP